MSNNCNHFIVERFLLIISSFESMNYNYFSSINFSIRRVMTYFRKSSTELWNEINLSQNHFVWHHIKLKLLHFRIDQVFNLIHYYYSFCCASTTLVLNNGHGLSFLLHENRLNSNKFNFIYSHDYASRSDRKGRTSASSYSSLIFKF